MNVTKQGGKIAFFYLMIYFKLYLVLLHGFPFIELTNSSYITLLITLL